MLIKSHCSKFFQIVFFHPHCYLLTPPLKINRYSISYYITFKNQLDDSMQSS